MNRLASALAVVAVLASPVRALAEEPPQAPSPAPSEPTPVVESAPLAAPEAAPAVVVESTPPAAAEDAWALYERAFAAAVAGRDDEALSLVAALKAGHPDTGAAALAGELERQLLARRGQAVASGDAQLRRTLEATAQPRERAPAGGTAAVPPSASGAKRYATLFEALHDEQPSAAARAEFLVFQTLHGIAVGGEICAATSGCGGGAGTLLVPMLTGGAGALGAYLFSDGGITPGNVLAIDSGALWGAWQGVALMNIAGGWSQGGSPLVLILAQGLGMGAGQLAWSALGLSAGDVSLMNTAGLWTGVYTLMALIAATGGSGDNAALFATLLVASDVGLVAGGLLSRHFPMSRGRTLLLDAGAILGGLLGLAVSVIAYGSEFGSSVVGYMLGGSVAGLAAATALSQEWDTPLLGPVQVGLAPTQHGGGQLMLSGRF
ncbi:MAG: hypothetical protein FJ086_02900 [Deltaproteobacteria bacterium]|nr:hypothetical protein [Deltaproteobacteria bacterium]